MRVHLSMYICSQCVYTGACGGEKKMSDFLELEVFELLYGTRKQTRIFWKCIECSYQLYHLSSLNFVLLKIILTIWRA